MYLKLALLSVSVLSFAGLTVGAEDTFDTCDIEIEGATVSMSADEAAAEWLSRGYVR